MTKRIQKFLAISLATTMALSTTVFAASSTSSGNVELTSVGTAQAIDEGAYYEVCLPTAAALQFKLDPQGLLALGAGEFGTLESLSANAGKLVGTTSACIINESALPIQVTVSMASTVTTLGDVKLVDTPEKVSENNLNNVLMYAIPCKDSISASANYTTASQGFILKQTPAVAPDLNTAADTLTFKLDKAVYTVSKNDAGVLQPYTRTGEGNGTGIQLGGLINPNANWIDFAKTSPTKSLGLKAIFAFSSTDKTPVVPNDFAYGFESAKEADGTTDLERIDANSGSINPITIAATKGATANKTATLAGTITSLKLVKLGAVDKDSVLSSTHYSASGSTLTLNGSWLSKLTETAVFEATITVNGADKTQKITVTFN